MKLVNFKISHLNSYVFFQSCVLILLESKWNFIEFSIHFWIVCNLNINVRSFWIITSQIKVIWNIMEHYTFKLLLCNLQNPLSIHCVIKGVIKYNIYTNERKTALECFYIYTHTFFLNHPFNTFSLPLPFVTSYTYYSFLHISGLVLRIRPASWTLKL